MTEKHWDPWKRQEPAEPTQRTDFWIPGLIPAAAQESIEAPEQVTLTIKSIIPHRLIDRPSWWRREAESVERVVLMLTTWILAVSFVFVGLVIGFVLTHLFELSMIILGWSA